MNLTRTHFAASVAAACFLTAAASADAATRYASPASVDTVGTCTTPATACRLDRAVGVAASGDTVQLLDGGILDYVVTYPVTATQPITLTADPNQPHPHIVSTNAIDLTKGGTVQHIFLESTAAAPALITKGGLVEDVLVAATVDTALFAKAGSGLVIRDTVARTLAAAPAVTLSDDQVTGSLDIVNVTAVAGALGSTGIENGSGGPVTIANTIASGAAQDIALNGTVDDALVTHSSFRPGASTGVIAGAGNITDPPLFVNLASGVFREATGSPTIDAGSAAAASLGSRDPDGNARILGPAPDIGAYETARVNPPILPDPPGDTPPTTPTVVNPGPTTTDPDRNAGRTSVLPPPAPPVLGRSVGLGAASGSVTVVLPGSSEAIPLDEGTSVPVGSVIDASRGVVELTSVRDDSGETQTGSFWGGRFRVRQSEKGDQYTVLKLVGRLPSCSAREKVSAAGRRRVRRLWGRDHGGRFRTRGRRGQATVRGTKWLTEDRCDGTFFRVKRGRIAVRDFGKRKTVSLGRGKSYLARAR
jgi:hypothetical protein